MLFISYVLEQFLVHSPDAAMAGGGYYLMMFTTRKGFGGAIFVAYCAMLYGMTLSDEAFDWWGPVAAALGIAIAQILGTVRRRSVKHPTTHPPNDHC